MSCAFKMYGLKKTLAPRGKMLQSHFHQAWNVDFALKEDIIIVSKEQKDSYSKSDLSLMEPAAKIQLVLSSLILLGIVLWLMLIKIWLFLSALSKKVNVDNQIYINLETWLIKLKILQSKVWLKEKYATSK